MAEAETKVPAKSQEMTERSEWQAFESLRREIDRLVGDFGQSFWRSPFRRSLGDLVPLLSREMTFAPAANFVEKDKAYEITAELPGLDEKDIEVKVANGELTIRGEKKEEKEEKEKGYYISERRYGSFSRYFRVPEGADPDKIEASFKNGVLTVTLPKKLEAQKPEKKIEVKSA
jgi:HSP20 family protein